MKPGEEWGTPTEAVPDRELSGDDTALAALVSRTLLAGGPVPLVRFHPHGSELARAVGLADDDPHVPDPGSGGRGSGGRGSVDRVPNAFELPIDAIETSVGVAMNAVVIGLAPAAIRARHRRRGAIVVVDDRTIFDGEATTIVIANGQFLDGLDVVPRGHPGDGRLEIQIYALDPGERAPMRRRLPSGTHLPHPHIACGSGRSIEFRGAARAWNITLDRRSHEPASVLTATVRPGAIRLLV